MTSTPYEAALVRHAQRDWLQHLDDHARPDCLSLDPSAQVPTPTGEGLKAVSWPEAQFVTLGWSLLVAAFPDDPRALKQLEIVFRREATTQTFSEPIRKAVRRFIAHTPPTPDDHWLLSLGVFAVAMACGRRRPDGLRTLEARFPEFHHFIEHARVTSQLGACRGFLEATQGDNHG